MAEIIQPDRAARGGGPGLSYWLGTKFLNQPLAMEAGFAARLQGAIKEKAFDPGLGTMPLGSKFIGTKAGASAYRVTDDGIAIVPISGALIDRGDFLGDMGGLVTSYEGLSEQFRRIGKDSAIKSVVLDIDSGGGSCAGLFDCCAELETLRRKYKVVAVAANMAASAAYAIACVCDEVYVTSLGIAGSIGVIAMHMSYADMLGQMGVEPTIIHAGAYKPNGNPYQALSHLARAEMAASCDQIYADFVGHVAKHRGIDEAAIRATEARCYTGEKAVAAKLADGVKSFEAVLEHIRAGASKGGRPRGQVKRASTTANVFVRALTKPEKGERTMSGQTPPGDRPDYDAMIAASLSTIAAATSRAAAPAAVAVAELVPAVIAAPAAAAVDEKARIKAIMGSDAAKARPALARHLALETQISAADADSILSASPIEVAQAAVSPGAEFRAAMRQPGASAGVRPDASAAAVAGANPVTVGMPSLADKMTARFPIKTKLRS